ncbi:MAG: beta-galactosidase [Candidatus Sumerlaeota bacterium]|nr:beta-galactosidase [Candidatus Sumerlaeota bacterium]
MSKTSSALVLIWTLAATAVSMMQTGTSRAADPQSGGAKVSFGERGVCIATPSDGQFILEYPILLDAAQKQIKPAPAQMEGKTAKMRYSNGAQMEATMDGSAITLHFTSLPAEAKEFRMEMAVPIVFKDGGKWEMEGGGLKPFPAKCEGEQFVFKGEPKPVKIVCPKGAEFTLSMPYGWQQMQDNRKWNGNSFGYMTSTQMPQSGAGEGYYTFSVITGAAGEAAAKDGRDVRDAKDAKNVAAAKGPAAGAGAAAVKAAVPAGKLSLKFVNEGIAIEAGSMAQLTLEYPVLVGARYDQIRKLIEKNITGNAAVLKFDAGAAIDLKLSPSDGVITVKASGITQDYKTIRMSMLIDFSYANGGAWKAGASPETPFPAEKPAKAFLYQETAETFMIKNFEGAALSFKLPSGSFQQLQDNREWGWKVFGWYFQIPYNPDEDTFPVKIAQGTGGGTTASGAGDAASAARKLLVDKFGQNAQKDFPAKVKSEEELMKDVEAEKQYYAGLTPPQRDTYGGLPGSKEKLGLKQTGFFHVEKHGERWILVDPEGNAFFHIGVCGLQPSDDFTTVKGRERVYEWLPPYEGDFKTAYRPESGRDVVSFHLANLIRKYGKPYTATEYGARMIERLRKWGFNSGGAFGGGDATARRAAQFPSVSHLPLSQWEGFPPLPGITGTFDPFDEKIRAQCEKSFSTRVAAGADDPLIIGYFLANEPLYEDIPRAIPTLNGKYACKQRLAQMLQEKYKTIEAFNKAWEASMASFEAVASSGLAVKTKPAFEDMQEFTGLFLDAYFKLICETFRKYDKNHILIGNRFQSGTINNEQLCRISGKYMDVISFNYYTYGLDKDFLKRIYGWTGGRPMFLSEFYYNSPKDSGLPGGGKDVASQVERGLGYRNYVEQAASLGFVVGIEWFTFEDQAMTGRWFEKFSGENGNTGLLSVTDRPWKEMLAEMMKTNYGIYDVFFSQRAPFTYDDPRFAAKGTGRKVAKIGRATGAIKINGLAQNWPGTPAETISSDRLVQGSDAGGVEASFKLCWDDTNLYLLANVQDPTPMKNDQKGDMIWSADGLELFIGFEKLDQSGPLLFTDRQILLSAGKADGKCQWFFAKAPEQPVCDMIAIPNVDGKGYTLEVALPFKALGFAPKAGQEILFDLGVDDSADGKARLRQLMWNGSARNSGDRSGWGRAAFAQ